MVKPCNQPALEDSGTPNLLMLGLSTQYKISLGVFLRKRAWGYLSVDTEEDAYLGLKRHNFDEFILDIDLVDRYAPCVVEKIRAQDKHINIIASSQFVFPELVEQIFRAGANHFVNHPKTANCYIQHLESINYSNHVPKLRFIHSEHSI